MKRWVSLALAAAMSMTVTGTAFAGWEWHDDDGNGIEGCYYFNEDGSLLRNAVTPDNCRVNENGLWTVNGVVQTRAGKTYDMGSAIQEIRDLYAYTNGHIGSYKKMKGYPDNSLFYAYEDETTYWDSDNNLMKRVVPGELRAEVYYYGSSQGVKRDPSAPYNYLAFIFAVDSKTGEEYRIYFKDWKVIRYIGPDHQNVDFPGGASFVSFADESIHLNGGNMIWSIMAIADPGWWIGYEGEDNGYACLTE